MPTRILCLCALILALLPASAAQRLYYTGAINTTLTLQMDLAFDGAKVHGRYYYESVGTEITLAGTRKANAITLKERANGKVTGIFTGTLAADLRAVTGTWTSADGKRKLPFALRAVAEYKTVTVKKPGYVLTGSYPAFFGTAKAMQALTKLLAARMAGVQAGFLKEAVREPDIPYPADFAQDYVIAITFHHPNLVSLYVTDYSYTGGAHPNTVYTSANYDTTGDIPTLLGQNDLFNKEKPYRDTLFTLVKADLMRQTKAREVTMWDTLSVKDLAVYTLSPTGITFIFSPYVVSYYAAGDFEVTIPYRQVLPFINWSGPLALFLEMGAPGSRPGVDPVTGLGAADAAKLGMDAFVDRYLTMIGFNGDNAVSWIDRRAFYTYAELKSVWNDRQAAVLPAAQRTLYQRTSGVMARLQQAHYTLEWITVGGTMLLDFAATDAGTRADILGNIIDALRPPAAKDPAARAQARKDFSSALAAVTARPATVDESSSVRDTKEYPTQLGALSQATADAQALSQELPDTAAALLAAFTKNMAEPEKLGKEGE
jgi:hypothetical protein